MFQLSSDVDNSHPAMAVLVEHGWSLPAAGRSRLFVQANHPQVIDEFSTLVKGMLKNNNPLLNMFARVSLDQYINASITTFKAPRQIGGTCYANAVASVFHLAMRRIEGRDGGVPAFDGIRQELIQAYGKCGAVTRNVLENFCPKYRLHYKHLANEQEARQALSQRRPVVATFQLYDPQWDDFGKFFHQGPNGVLQSKNIRPHKPGPNEKSSGHAVVLIRCEPDALVLMNSWGPSWADGGFFRIRDASVLGLQFYDVYWTLDDLTQREKQAYAEKGKAVAKDIANRLPESVKSLPYKCPKCGQCSPANSYKGHFIEAECPRCAAKFIPSALGLVLY